jgi:hypothetical protein
VLPDQKPISDSMISVLSLLELPISKLRTRMCPDRLDASSEKHSRLVAQPELESIQMFCDDAWRGIAIPLEPRASQHY